MTVAVLRSRQYVTNDTKELTGTVRPTWIDFSILSSKAVAIFPNLVQAGEYILVSAAFLLSNIFCHVVTSQLKSIFIPNRVVWAEFHVPQQLIRHLQNVSTAVYESFWLCSNIIVRWKRAYILAIAHFYARQQELL